METYRVLRIEEQLYGCEELPEGQPVLCDVLLENAAGERRVLPYPDAELTALDINEGDTITVKVFRDDGLAEQAGQNRIDLSKIGEGEYMDLSITLRVIDNLNM